MSAGLDVRTALCMPRSMLEDVIASHDILEAEWEREYTDPDDIERDFLRTMSKR